MLNECIPFYRPGQDISAAADSALIGCRLCMIVEDRTGGPLLGDPTAIGDDQNLHVVDYPSAGGRVFGVVGWDVAQDAIVPVKRNGVLPVKAAEALSAADPVKTNATGQLLKATAGSVVVGFVLADCASGSNAEFVLAESAGGAGEVDIASQAALTHLTDNSGGAAADSTIGAVTLPTLATWDGAHDPTAGEKAEIIAADTALRDAIKELSAAHNALLTKLESAGILV